MSSKRATGLSLPAETCWKEEAKTALKGQKLMVYGRWHLNELFFIHLFCFRRYILAIYHMYFSIVLVYVCI